MIMYKHKAESILETAEKKFISQTDKDKYDGYDSRFREKNDTYTKQEIEGFTVEFEDVVGNATGQSATVIGTKEGFVDLLEVKGDTQIEEITIIPVLGYGRLSKETGEVLDSNTNYKHTTDFIEVNDYDLVSYLNNGISRNAHVFLYDSYKRFVSYIWHIDGKDIEIPYGCSYMKAYTGVNDTDNISISIKRNDASKNISVGNMNENGLCEIKLKSIGKNLFNIDTFYESIKDISGVSRTEKGIFFDCNINSKIGIEVFNVANIPFKAERGKRYCLRADVVNDGDFKARFCFRYTDGTDSIRSEINNDISKDIDSIVFNWYTQTNGGTTLLENIMLCEIEEADVGQDIPFTTYEEDIVTITTNTQLEKIGSVYDRLVKKDNKLVIEKNINDLNIYNATMTLEEVVESAKTVVMKLDFGDKLPVYTEDNINVICNLLPSKLVNATTDSEGVYIESGTKSIIVMQLYKERLNDDVSYNGIKQYLQKNVTVLKTVTRDHMILELPQTRDISLKSFNGNTTVMLETEVSSELTINCPKTLQSAIESNIDKLNSINNVLNDLITLEETTSTNIECFNRTLIESTNNGYIDDIKIEGNTLVNIATVTDVSQLSCAGDGTNVTISMPSPGKYRWEKTETSENTYYPKIIIDSKSYGPIVPGKKYTVMYKVRSNINMLQGFAITNGDAYVSTVGESYDYDIARKCFNVMKPNYNVITCIEAKAPINASDTRLSIGFGSGIHAAHWIEISDLVIVEGEYTDKDFSYFEGIKSVGSEGTEYNMVALNPKYNLCDWYNETCVMQSGVASRYKRLIKLNLVSNNFSVFFINNGKYISSEKIAIRLKDRSGRSLIYREDGNDFIVSTWMTNISLNNFKVKYKDVAYLEIFWNNKLTEKVTIDQVFVTHDTITDSHKYTPMVVDKKEILYLNSDGEWTSPILRRVNETIRDTIEKHDDGKYYYHKRCEEVIINGSEAWQKHTGIEDDDKFCYFISHIYDESLYFDGHVTNLVAERFITTNRRTLELERSNAICINSGDNNFHYYGLKILKSVLTTADADGLKSWLSANPITIVREDAEKIFECTPIDLKSYEGDTIISIDSPIISPKITTRVNNDVSTVIETIKEKISILESDLYTSNVIQNKLLLNSIYTSSTMDLKVDIAARTAELSYDTNEDEYIVELLYRNIIVGRSNYERNHMEEMIDFFAMVGKISFETAEELLRIIAYQHGDITEE